MEDISKVVMYSALYDLYKGLLTDTQRDYFESYYFMNNSYSEIAEAKGVSRAAVCDCIKKVVDELLSFEKTLSLKKKEDERETIIEALKSHTDSDGLSLISKLEEI